MTSNIDKIREHYAQLQREKLDREIPREDAQITEGVKALLAINGGGIVAMLGFMQALILKANSFATFKYYGMNALLFFVLGLGAAALVPLLRAVYINSLIYEWKRSMEWELASYGAWLASVGLFAVGVFFVGQGIHCGLP